MSFKLFDKKSAPTGDTSSGGNAHGGQSPVDDEIFSTMVAPTVDTKLLDEQKELRKLSRQELLELLLYQGQQMDELERRLREAEEQLNERKNLASTFDSMAQAMMRSSEAAESANRTVDDFAAEREEMLQAFREQQEQIVANARAEAEQIRRAATGFREKMLALTAEELQEKIREAKTGTEAPAAEPAPEKPAPKKRVRKVKDSSETE